MALINLSVKHGRTLDEARGRLEMAVAEVHATGDIAFLGGLLGGPLASGLKQIVQQAFQKKLV